MNLDLRQGAHHPWIAWDYLSFSTESPMYWETPQSDHSLLHETQQAISI
jgi:hypothetical protein